MQPQLPIYPLFLLADSATRNARGYTTLSGLRGIKMGRQSLRCLCLFTSADKAAEYVHRLCPANKPKPQGVRLTSDATLIDALQQAERFTHVAIDPLSAGAENRVWRMVDAIEQLRIPNQTN